MAVDTHVALGMHFGELLREANVVPKMVVVSQTRQGGVSPTRQGAVSPTRQGMVPPTGQVAA